jgi:hypothetical protein
MSSEGQSAPGTLLPPVALTLFVKAHDAASERACEELQAVMSQLAEDVSVSVFDLEAPEAARMGVSMAPMLRVQRGSSTPEWVVKVERDSLPARLSAFGVRFR